MPVLVLEGLGSIEIGWPKCLDPARYVTQCWEEYKCVRHTLVGLQEPYSFFRRDNNIMKMYDNKI